MFTAIACLLIGYGIAHIPATRLDTPWAKLKLWFEHLGQY